MTGDGVDPVARLLVPAVTAAAAALTAPVAAAALREAVAGGLRRRAGLGRVVIPGDRLPVSDPGGPEAVEFDVGLRGRFAGRVHAAIACAVWDDGEADPATAVIRALAAAAVRANAGYVVASAPTEVFAGPWADVLATRARAVATVARGVAHGVDGLRVPARVALVPVANSPLVSDPGWGVRAYRVEGQGGEAVL